MIEHLTVYVTLKPHFSKRVPQVTMMVNYLEQVKVPELKKHDTEYQIEIPISATLHEQITISIQLAGKQEEDNLVVGDEILINQGVVVSDIAVKWGATDRDDIHKAYMNYLKGSEDNTNRNDPEWERQKQLREESVSNSLFTRYPLSDTQVIRSCQFLNRDGVSSPMTPKGKFRIFKIRENGEFTFKFSAPFAYWALKNSI